MTSGQKCLICRGDANRHACDACIADIRRRLRELELYACWLSSPAMLAPMRGGAGRRSPGYGSRPPIRLAALAMTDARSRTEPPLVDENRGVGLDNDDTTWPILDTLRTIAGWIREHRDHPAPRRITLASEIGYILSAVDWAAGHEGVADLADHIRRLHIQARAVAHDTPPAPLGTCLSVGCDGAVFPPPPRRDTAHCSRCDRSYTGLALVKLRLAQEAGRP